MHINSKASRLYAAKLQHCAAAFLLTFAHAVYADDAAIVRCRALTNGADRLTCYDAIVVQMPSGPPSTAPAVAVQPPNPQQEFGMPQQAAPAAKLESIESHIAGSFDGWRGNQKIELANGQVWQVADGSSAALRLTDPKVTVRRGMLGAFYLDIDGTNRSPRVKRVK